MADRVAGRRATSRDDPCRAGQRGQSTDLLEPPHQRIVPDAGAQVEELRSIRQFGALVAADGSVLSFRLQSIRCDCRHVSKYPIRPRTFEIPPARVRADAVAPYRPPVVPDDVRQRDLSGGAKERVGERLKGSSQGWLGLGWGPRVRNASCSQLVRRLGSCPAGDILRHRARRAVRSMEPQNRFGTASGVQGFNKRLVVRGRPSGYAARFPHRSEIPTVEHLIECNLVCSHHQHPELGRLARRQRHPRQLARTDHRSREPPDPTGSYALEADDGSGNERPAGQ